MVFSTMGLPVFADDTNPGEPFGDGSAACAASLLSEEETLFWSDLADTSWYVEGETEFTISTAEELAGLAKLVDEYDVYDSDEDGYLAFKGVTINLGADIDLEGAAFNPIGSYKNDKAFCGTFNGNGYSINNMSQDYVSLDNSYYYSDLGLGLFGLLFDATVTNLTIDGAEISGYSSMCGAVAAAAYGDCTFEDITVSNSNIADYQYYAGGIVGWASGNHKYIGCYVTDTTTVGSQWGDFDNSVGGVIGGSGSSATIYMSDCDIDCRLDAYSDVTSTYQWYAYRRAGMIVGNSNKSTVLEGTTYAVPNNFTIEDCRITIGDWGNYTYCEFAGTSWPWVRCQEGLSNSAYSNPRYGHPTDAEGNEVTDDNHAHNDGEGHQVIIGFSQLFGGGQGVYGATKEVLEKIGGYDSVTESLEIIDLAKEARSCVELFKAIENEELISLNDAEENSVELVSVGLFESLQDAINAMGTDAGEYTIVIKKNITEDVSITQNDGQKVTIKGGTNDVTLNGSITIDGTSIGENDMDDDSLTITGINFVTDTADHTFISGVITNHYPHNVLISDCTFTGTGNNDTVAVRLKSSYDCAIKDCVGTGLHSMLQNTSGHRLTVEDIEINNSKSGISLGTVQGATLKNINITATGDYGYGIRMDGSEYVGDVSIENATINATAPIILRKADKITSSYDIELKGTNNLATPDNSDYTVIVVAKDYDEENTVLAASDDKKIFVTIEDESLSIDNVFGAKYPPAVVEDANGNKTTYASLAEAVAEATANDSIVIYDKIEDFATLVNNGTTFKNITVKLGRDFDLNNEEWTPIGTNTNKFLGTFDGDNHTVSNLKIDTPSTSYVGFFGFTSEGEVKNLTINNASVKGRLGVGAFAGSPYTSKMTNLKLTGDVAIEGMSYVGGMLGRNLYANATDLTVDVNDGSYVKATSTENGTRYRTYLGGVIGFMGEGNITVKNVTSNIDVIGDVMDIGGIVGIIHYGNSFINIASSGNVTATSAEAALEIGGIAGTVMNSEQPVTIDKLEYTGDLSVTLEDGTVITEEELSSHKLYGNVYYPDKPTTGMLKAIKVNDTYYSSLQDAMDAVEDGGTISIIADHTITEATRVHNSASYYDGTYYIGDKSFTLDLNGFTITDDGSVNDYLLNFKNDGSKENVITIKNGTIEASTNAYAAICTSTASTHRVTINLENVNVNNNNSNGAAIKMRGGALLNVNDGTVITGKNSYLGIEVYGAEATINEGAKIYMNGTSSYNGCLAGVGNAGVLNVYGGYGRSAKGGFIAMTTGGTINVYDGEWIANTAEASNAGNSSVLIAQNDKATYTGIENSVINVYGGTFTGDYNCYGNAVGDAQINISGGTFSDDPANYLVSGFKAYPNADGSYTIAPDRTINVSADKPEVEADDEVIISISVSGENLANAKWKLKYDSSKFELVTTGLNVENDVITDHLYLDDDTVFTSGEVIKSYTFKAIAQTDDTQADFEISDTFAYTYLESLDGTDIEALNNEKATVNIKLKDYKVVVKVDDNEIAAGETTREFAYDDNEHTFKVDTIPTATVEYKVNGRTVNNVVIKNEGKYEIEYSVIAETGYRAITSTYTITVGAPKYVIEIGATEYVAGKKIVLVYTNTDNAFFKYDGNLMIDVTSSGYKYNDGTTETQYAHVFAFVTDVVTGASDDDYKANVSHLYSSSGLYTIAQYDNDINFDTDLDIRDITSEYAVYNVNADVFRYIRYQKNILKADTDGSKSVTLDDTANVVNGIVNP